jgi:hypothetical protein
MKNAIFWEVVPCEHIAADAILHGHCHENLKSYIVFYGGWGGGVAHQHIQQLEILQTKKAKILCTLPCLLRCRDHSTILFP